MSDAEKTKVNKETDDVKSDVEEGNHNEPSPGRKHQGEMSDAEKTKVNKEMDGVKPGVEEGNHNEPSPSNPAQNSVTANPQDDIQRKTLEALFQLNRAKVCQQMWNIYNS